MDETEKTGETNGSRGKVATLIERYRLEGIGEEMEDHWTRDTGERKSLRDLADHFNEALLRERLQRAGVSPLDGEVANIYRLLTDDDVSSGKRVQAENNLSQHDIDADQLRTEFVSRQAIHTFLTKDRQATYERETPSDEDRLEARIETIGRLKNRVAAVAERAVSEVLGQNQSETRYHVAVLVQVRCDRCNTQYPITEFLRDRGCDCRSTDD